MMPAQKPHRSKQNYATPADFIAATHFRLGIERFAFDFAASAMNTKAKFYFTKRQNALTKDWAAILLLHEWGWLNPPYTDIEPWAHACADLRIAGKQIAFLVPASVGANWFRDHVDGKALVLMLNGRLAFMPNKPTWLYPKDCVLCLYSPDIAPGYEVWDWRKQIQKAAA